MANKKKAISGSPTAKVKDLVLKRNGATFTATWSHPDNYNSDDNDRRIEWYNVEWHFDAFPRPKKGWPLEHEYGGSYPKSPNPYPAKVSKNPSTIIKEEYLGLVDHVSQTISRAIYNPTKKAYLEKVYVKVISGNAKGQGAVQTSAQYVFKVPKNPQMGGMSYNSSNGRLSCVVKIPNGTDNYDRVDTMYRITRRDNKPNTKYKKAKAVKDWYRNTSDQHTMALNLGDNKNLTYGQWIEMKFQCYSRGLRGKSSTMTKSWIFCHPSKPAVGTITKCGNFQTGYVVVNVTVRADSKEAKKAAFWRVNQCKLQYATTTSKISATAAASLNWTDVNNAVDDANVKGFEQPISDLGLYEQDGTRKGLHVWYRVVNSNEDYTQYSVPKEATCLYLAPPDATDDTCKILKLESQDDGETLFVVVGHKNDDSNAVLLEWSTYSNALKSNTLPESMTIDWGSVSGDNRVVKDADWPYEMHAYLRDLHLDVPYYFWARRTNTATGEMGTRCSVQSITLEDPPSNVVLSIPAYLVRGQSVRASWTFESNNEQTSWKIQIYKEGSWKNLQTGTDPNGSAIIPADTLTNKYTSAELRVLVSTGGTEVASPSVDVNVMTEPACGVNGPSVLTAQPMTFSVGTDISAGYVIAKIFSKMGVTELPDGTLTQEYGECVWSDKIEPSWISGSAVSGDGTTKNYAYASFTADPATQFIDGTEYFLTVVVVDSTTGLASEERTHDFSVNWANKPMPPGAGTYVVGSQTDKTATIYLVADENAQSTDVADIYRVTPDRVTLIASNVIFGKTVLDRYAPYAKTGDLYYRIATRTIDGAVAWSDVPYSLPGHATRFDWGNDRFLEVPFNLKLTTSRKKDSELRTHLDGGTIGVWNSAISRKLSMSSDLIRLGSVEEKRLLAELGSYPGPVYVRTREGAAFLADVQVSSTEDSYDSLLYPVKIDANEIDLTEKFMVQSSDIEGTQYDGSIEPEGVETVMLYEGPDAPVADESEYMYGDEIHGMEYKVYVALSDDDYETEYEVQASDTTRLVEYSDELGMTWEQSMAVVQIGILPSDLIEKIASVEEDPDILYRVLLRK